jgi:hypothetical protein
MKEKVKKKNSPPAGKKLCTIYLDSEELKIYKVRAKANGLSLSRYFAHLARRDALGENEDLRLYTETGDLKRRLEAAIDESEIMFNKK